MKSNHTEISLPSANGKTPHVIIKEFVAERTGSNEYDRVFDAAHQLGLSNGTEAYDQAIEMILAALQIPEALIYARLKALGVNI